MTQYTGKLDSPDYYIPLRSRIGTGFANSNENLMAGSPQYAFFTEVNASKYHA
jgi:hypothetical protein